LWGGGGGGGGEGVVQVFFGCGGGGGAIDVVSNFDGGLVLSQLTKFQGKKKNSPVL